MIFITPEMRFKKINFYLTFSVLRRLVLLISRQATLEASHAATVKQALGASEQAKKLLEENEKLTVSYFIILSLILTMIFTTMIMVLIFLTKRIC